MTQLAVFAGSLCNYLTYDTALGSARRMTFGAVSLAKSSVCGICSRSLDDFFGGGGKTMTLLIVEGVTWRHMLRTSSLGRPLPRLPHAGRLGLNGLY